MHTGLTSLRIGSILFDNTDTKVLIKGETFKNHLSYPSEMFISFSELNALMNYLQKQNPALEVTDLFEEEIIGTDYSASKLNGNLLVNNTVDMSFFSFGTAKKLIRA